MQVDRKDTANGEEFVKAVTKNVITSNHQGNPEKNRNDVQDIF